MRRIIFVLVLLVAACTSAPKPAVKSAAGLPPLWVPAKAMFREVPELPILGTGKLDLKGCKQIAHKLVEA